MTYQQKNKLFFQERITTSCDIFMLAFENKVIHLDFLLLLFFMLFSDTYSYNNSTNNTTKMINILDQFFYLLLLA
jgi:hypothetical protein